MTKVTIALCALIWVAASSAVMAHPGHPTHAELTWNPKARAIEVALRINTGDLDLALSRRAKCRNDKGSVEPRTFCYIRDHFRLLTGKTSVEPQLIGTEIDGSEVWVYFEFQLHERDAIERPMDDASSRSPSGCSLHNTLLLELFNEQQNFVEIAVAGEGKKQTVTFDTTHRAYAWTDLVAPPRVTLTGKEPVSEELRVTETAPLAAGPGLPVGSQ